MYNDYFKCPLTEKTVKQIAAVQGCHENNLDWWEITGYIERLVANNITGKQIEIYEQRYGKIPKGEFEPK